MIATGKTFLVPSGPGHHLFFIVLGPIIMPMGGKEPQFVSVNATTIKENLPFDDACILNPGDHPFIRHKSYISYRYARVDTMGHLEKMKDIWIPHEDCSPEVLERIVAGAKRSRLVRRDLKLLFK